MYFNEEYDLKPPVVLFSTVPFHPNSKFIFLFFMILLNKNNHYNYYNINNFDIYI